MARVTITKPVAASLGHIAWWSGLFKRRRPKTLIVLLAMIVVACGMMRPTRAQSLASLSSDLLSWLALPTSAQVQVIIPGTPAALSALLVTHPLPVVRWLTDSVVVTVNPTELAALAADPAVSRLSGDVIVAPTMAISDVSTGASRTWNGAGYIFPFGSTPGVTGRGIGIAVIDSGISSHSALAGKVVASVSMVPGDPSVNDAFGHGTHVAGIIAGLPVGGSFPGGIAPGAHLINVRVLAADGTAHTSDVIAGIDWAIAHRADYNIRIINLSVGHPVMEPALTDPLCLAVARAVSQGLMVTVSAGNNGRNRAGHPVLGGIGSPGNSPYAFTVGALNTWGSVDRRDDTVAEYSSRGPTRFELAVKPDLAAPGTHIVSLEAAGSYLPLAYPVVHTAGSGTNAYMSLSGTSMAAPMVAGSAALLLEGVPSLTATQLKLMLQAGATYVPKGGLLGAGAGSLNVWTSRLLTTRGPSFVPIGGDGEASGASFWDTGALSASIYQGVGVRLLSLLDLLSLWTNPALLRVGELNLIGLLNPLKFIPAQELIWGNQVASWALGPIVWDTPMSDPGGNQIIWGTWENDQIIWGTSENDQIIWGTSQIASPDAR